MFNKNRNIPPIFSDHNSFWAATCCLSLTPECTQQTEHSQAVLRAPTGSDHPHYDQLARGISALQTAGPTYLIEQALSLGFIKIFQVK